MEKWYVSYSYYSKGSDNFGSGVFNHDPRTNEGRIKIGIEINKRRSDYVRPVLLFWSPVES